MIDLAGADVSQSPCYSVDLRRDFGVHAPDESCLLPAGTFRRALFVATPGEYPTGEVRVVVAGREIRIVRELTNRPGIVEMTPEMIAACDTQEAYRDQWRAYLGVT